MKKTVEKPRDGRIMARWWLCRTALDKHDDRDKEERRPHDRPNVGVHPRATDGEAGCCTSGATTG